jgi:hypothetical protein
VEPTEKVTVLPAQELTLEGCMVTVATGFTVNVAAEETTMGGEQLPATTHWY